MNNALYIALATLIINIPLGYWRETVKTFSAQWFIAVHAAVPLLIAMRLYAEIKWELAVMLFFLVSYFGGQFIGSRYKRHLNRQNRAA